MTIKVEWEFEDDESEEIINFLYMSTRKPLKLSDELILKIIRSSSIDRSRQNIRLGNFLINSGASISCINDYLRNLENDNFFTSMESGVYNAFRNRNIYDDDIIIRLIKIDPNNINKINNPTEEMKELYKVLTM